MDTQIDTSGNSLFTWCHENNKLHLLEEFSYEKNYTLTPKDVTYGSNRRIYWRHICDSGEVVFWEASVKSRTRHGNGCPKCSKNREGGFSNRLYDWCIRNNRQDLLEEYDYERNYPLTPKDIARGSRVRLHWKHTADDGITHYWEAAVCNRAKNETGCPYCAGNILIQGVSDIYIRGA